MNPNSATLDHILRAMQQLALSDALMQELAQVATEIGQQAFVPAPMVAADGSSFPLNMVDTSFHSTPEQWVPFLGGFKQVLITQQLRPVPPFPMLQLLGYEGTRVPDTQVDQNAVAIYEYVVDAVTIVSDDNPIAASRRAEAYCNAYDRLVKRNESLGGLVYLIETQQPPTPGGEVEQSGLGVVSGMLMRYHARALRVI